MEKHILVIDHPTSININYFERLFANSAYDCRIVTTKEGLLPLIENLRFLYIFIGEFTDMTWFPLYKYGEAAYIVLYSDNAELVNKQRQYTHECSVVPIRMMNRFLTEMEVINTTPTYVDPAIIF